MNEQEPTHEQNTDVFNIRPDVVRALRHQPPVSFEDLYDKLKRIDAEYALQLLADANRYSHDPGKKQAFAAGVLHVLNAQLASHEVAELEANFNAPGDEQQEGN